MKVHELFETEERSILSVMGEQPEHYNGDFNCFNRKLTSLKGAPKTVNGDFYCYDNNLTSLKGAPTFVNGGFNCCDNDITSFEGASTTVNGYFWYNDNKLASLHNIHKHNKEIGKTIWFANNPITSHILGLLLIKKLKAINIDLLTDDLLEASKIINKHLSLDRDVIDCQEELISAGLKEYAKL